jgi:hypothetical protein
MAGASFERVALVAAGVDGAELADAVAWGVAETATAVWSAVDAGLSVDVEAAGTRGLAINPASAMAAASAATIANGAIAKNFSRGIDAFSSHPACRWNQTARKDVQRHNRRLTNDPKRPDADVPHRASVTSRAQQSRGECDQGATAGQVIPRRRRPYRATGVGDAVDRQPFAHTDDRCPTSDRDRR